MSPPDCVAVAEIFDAQLLEDRIAGLFRRIRDEDAHENITAIAQKRAHP